MIPIVLPRQLAAPLPGWIRETDVIVVGSGIAGLATAIHARGAGHRVLVVTKSVVTAGSTAWAQGGIAAAMAEDDSPADHLHDTLVAGAGLCDVPAVEVLVNDGPRAIVDLVDWGTKFDRDHLGKISLTREGGHLRRRIAHAGGDATGAEIARAMVAAVANSPGIEVIEHALVLDLLKDRHGHVQGLTLHIMGEGQSDGIGAALAPVVVLATGGVGQVFSASTNPAVATGDGVALGLRAGAVVTDMEFVQFHPTVLYLGQRAVGQQPLISEALRGEGALLRDANGHRFMPDVHELAELAPRDIVAKAIMRSIEQNDSEHVWLDARGFGRMVWEQRFPTILASCQAAGVDPDTQLIPVAPAQHYISGGLRTDSWGRTTVPGLFAVGECSCTGVHGANRLASNSLLEGLVFADRIGDVLHDGLPERNDPQPQPTGELIGSVDRVKIQSAMTRGAGVLRSAESLHQTLAAITDCDRVAVSQADTLSWETANVQLVAAAITTAATIRTETRGSHWREDFPQADPSWLRHTDIQMTESGTLTASFSPVLTEPAKTISSS